MKVRTGSSAKEIVIVVRQSPTNDLVVTWDVDQNQELESFDTGLDPEIFWDNKGKAHICQDNIITICN